MQKSIAEHSMGDGVARNVAAPVPDGRDHMSGFGLVGCTAHWRGRQWAVTDTGVEALNGKYHIAIANIWADRDGQHWIEHMQHHYWVDIRDFKEALTIAQKRWPRAQ